MTHARLTRRSLATATLAVLGLTLSACSAGLGAASSPSAAGGSAAGAGEVVLLTHESFNVPEGVFANFERDTGLKVTVKSLASAGELANQLVLTKDAPLGDAFYGVDNTFGSRVAESGALASFTPADLPSEFATYNLPGDDGATMTPIDHSAVCVNADTAWFESRQLALPATLDDLLKPEYKGLLAVPAATGSTGMAFLLATIGEKGENGWQAYWRALLANGARIDKDWTQAYEASFTAGGGNGQYPLVVSYDTSPAFTTTEDGSASTTQALLDTCFQQTEYSGVLQGAKNADGAGKLVSYLASAEFQALLPDSMYVFPVRSDVALPTAWQQFAKPATQTIAMDPAAIDANRQKWQTEWQQIASQ
ncbi:thiamine ABC transporter substrate-binding protein [Micrococcales bacterium 31B]|nr:thiamine ABC transporter substrate-binding protein [Micrococcales bacterium 31B]